LSNTLSAINGTKYQITYTVTNRTAGSFTVSFGGNTSQSITESGNFNVNATANTTLTITPTADFNGTIILSVKIYGIATNPYNQNGYNVNKLTTKWSQFPDYTNGSARSINTSYQEKQDGFLFVEITLNLSLNSGICITLNGVKKWQYIL
jgi:hypothetical protein